MTDRELLERAAKAAGIRWKDWTQDISALARAPWMNWPYDWNPLTEDGDALRLAVKLGIGVQCHVTDGSGYALASSGESVVENIEAGTDPYAATRRAIVRAGAALGEAA